MTSVRTLLLLGLVAAACAAPVEHQVAGQSHTEAELEQTAEAPAKVALASAEVEAESQPEDVQVSVSSSTSVEITTVMSSVSSEMEPLPEPAGRPQGAEEAAPGVEEEEAPGAEVEAPGAEVETSQAEVEANQAEVEKAAEEEEDAELEVNTTINEVDVEPATTTAAAEASKAAADDAAEPTSLPSTVEVATSSSMVTTETMMSVSSETGEKTAVTQAAVKEAESSGDGAEEVAVVSDAAYASDSSEPLEVETEGSGVAADLARADFGTDMDDNGLQTDFEGSGIVSDESSGDSESADDNTTKGTLIFDLGPSASDELHDLVQQTVLDTLMDEGLLSTTAADDARPVIEAEGSGIVFLDESGSGDGAAEDISTSPFVSIHF